MSNILTPDEAANFCRTTVDDALMLQLLEQVDKYVQNATGRDWTQDDAVDPVAKAAASILLVCWYDDPSTMGSAPAGLIGPLLQLEAEALKYRKVQFYGCNGSGSVAISGAWEGDQVVKLVGIYGVSGDQSASFESTISTDGQILQTSGSDLSSNLYVVVLKSPADDVVI